MCNGSCANIWTWCKSFTKTERALVLIELLLIIVFIGFLVFIILHLIVCGEKSKSNNDFTTPPNIIIEPDENTSSSESEFSIEDTSISENTNTYTDTETIYTHGINTNIDAQNTKTSAHSDNEISITYTGEVTYTYDTTVEYVATSKPSSSRRNIKCTWKPSLKTEASRYFLNYFTHNNKIISTIKTKYEPYSTRVENKFLCALVKILSSNDVKFGCVLTVISKFWTITTAHCLDDIQKHDTLKSYVIMTDYEKENVDTFSIIDIQISSQTITRKGVYLAAIKSNSPLGLEGVPLANNLDYILLTIGNRFTILGYSNLR